jgi:hypothetical protein
MDDAIPSRVSLAEAKVAIIDPICSHNKLYRTSGFWPRVRARALRAPAKLGLLTCQTGRCAPLAHGSFAASYTSPKNNY